MRLFGPERSKFGKWLDRRGISQTDLSKESGVPVSTISSLARGEAKRPTRLTMKKLMNALRNIDPSVTERDFWSV